MAARPQKWRSHQLSIDKFCDSCTPSMRKVNDGGENGKTGEEIGKSLSMDRKLMSVYEIINAKNSFKNQIEGGVIKRSF